MIRRPPRSTLSPSSAASDVYKRQPVNDQLNQDKYKNYFELSKREKNLYIGGRMAEYAYYNMDQIVRKALDLSRKLLENEK